MSAPAVSAAQCAAAYEHPAVTGCSATSASRREALTRRAFELWGSTQRSGARCRERRRTSVLLAAGGHGCRSVGVEYGARQPRRESAPRSRISRIASSSWQATPARFRSRTPSSTS